MRTKRGTWRIVLAVATASAVLVAPARIPTAGAAAAAAGVEIQVPAGIPTIQGAIDAASAGDTVVVAPGTYHERIDFKGKAIEVRSSAGPSTTTIDGDGGGHVVRFRTGEARTSALRGFTITDGLATQTIFGAGIAIENASPTIVGNVITANGGNGHSGAGIGVGLGSPLILGNHIFDNQTGSNSPGGGIFAVGPAEIVGNLIEGNTAGGGGGVMLGGAGATLTSNVIRGNHALAFHGGGVSLRGDQSHIVQNLISGNTADLRGGGVYWEETGPGAAPELVNNTIVANTAPNGSAVAGASGAVVLVNNVVVGAVECQADAGPASVFRNNNVYNGGTPPYVGCPNRTGTNGNISADPFFVSAAGPTPSYRLAGGSPSIEAGDDSVTVPATDLDGLTRRVDSNGDGAAIIDMGAYETAPFSGTLQQTPYSVWLQPATTPLDGFGNWVAVATDPVAAAGQVAPNYLFGDYFGFESNPALGFVGLTTTPEGKFAVFSAPTQSIRVPLNWSANRFYFLFVFRLAPGSWGAWVYDDTAATWIPIGVLTLPTAWGRAAPVTVAAAPWLGPAGPGCSLYPRADVFFSPPLGYVGATVRSGTLSTSGVLPGTCPPTISQVGPWIRYQVGGA
ncbi:MAG: serine protease [Actinomycetota bacterium]|jgi:hypothetical protein|nr:serine protease [Actinomycetota bacterium]